MATIPVGIVAEVNWVDSIRHEGWWQRKEVLETIQKESMCHTTVGLVIWSGSAAVALAQSWHESQETFCQVMQIPSGAVLSWRVLREPEIGEVN